MSAYRIPAFLWLVVVVLLAAGTAAAEDRVNRVIIEAIESARPQAPADLLRAVDSLVNIGEFELANKYLDQAVGSASSRDELADLLDQFGSPFFVRLSLQAPLQPTIDQYLRRVFDAARAAATDATRLAESTQQLADESLDLRLSALNRLRRAGPFGVAAILNQLADPESQIDHVPLQAALAQFGPSSQPVLVAALRCGAGRGRLPYQAIVALQANIHHGEVVPDMLRWCFADDQPPAMQHACQRAVAQSLGQAATHAEARDFLLSEINALLRGEISLDADLDGLSRLWFWGAQGLEQRVYPQEVAQLIRATQLAGDLYLIDNETSQPRLLFAATQLATAKVTDGISQPLAIDSDPVQHVLSEFSSVELQTVMAFAVERGLIPAAIATAELLGQVETHGNLGSDVTRSALSSALRYPNRRLQFAAAEAIMRLNPGQPFAGANDLMHVLTRFASTRGVRRVLIISPIRSEADLITGALPSLGFVGDIATNGRQALSRLRQLADYDLILLDDATSSPKWSELIQQLRYDHFSRNIPICIMAEGPNERLADEIADRYEKTVTFPTPYDVDSMAVLMNYILPARRDDQLSDAERNQYASAAIGWLGKIAADRARYSFLSLGSTEAAIVGAINYPATSAKAVTAAGYLGTPAAQQALLAYASDSLRSVSAREAAIAALNTAIRRRGLLLTRPQLLAQYDRYNEAVDGNEGQAELLSRILDAFERPSGASSR